MARIRTIKPEFWTDEKVMDMPPLCRLLFIGLWNLADDYGRLEYSPRTIRARLLPEDGISIEEMESMLKHLSANGQITVYSAEGKEYIAVTNWDKHQKVDHKTKSKLPAPCAVENSETTETLASPREDSREDAKNSLGREGKGKEGKEDAPAADAAHSVSDPPATPEVEFFRRSKQVFGKHGGALGKKLLDAKGGNVALAHAALLTASTKQDPREYLGAIIRGRGDSPEDLRARGEAW